MPKLSASSLQKMFTCPYCGVSLRTRQGLSGHIQFLHRPGGFQNTKALVQPAPQQADHDSYEDELKVLRERFRRWDARKNDFTQMEFEQGRDLLRRWFILKKYFHDIQIEVTDKDFKHFFIQNFGMSDAMFNQEMQAVLEALKLVEKSITKSTGK